MPPLLPQLIAPRDTSYALPTSSNPNVTTGTTNVSSVISDPDVIAVFGVVLGVLGAVIAILNLWVNAQTLILCRKQLPEVTITEYPSSKVPSTTSLSGLSVGTAFPFNTISSMPSRSPEPTNPSETLTLAVYEPISVMGDIDMVAQEDQGVGCCVVVLYMYGCMEQHFEGCLGSL